MAHMSKSGQPVKRAVLRGCETPPPWGNRHLQELTAPLEIWASRWWPNSVR
jgi:hypothetical protein